MTSWTAALQASLSMGFSSKNTGGSCPALLQGIFPTQGYNPGAGRVFTIWATRKALSMLNVHHSHVEDGTVFVLLGGKEAWSCLVTCRRAWWARAKLEYASSLRSVWLQRAVSHLLCLAAASLKPSPAWALQACVPASCTSSFWCDWTSACCWLPCPSCLEMETLSWLLYHTLPLTFAS